jgi:serine/threonine protein kinase
LIGETLGHRYTLVAQIGRGGMGAVYAAEQRDTRERVAVKVLHSHLIEPGSDGLRRFRREAEAARSIHDDHIVRVIDAGTDEATGHLYLVTEHLEGEDLQRLLDRVGPLSTEAALRIALQALEGLSAAHDARVVHRDIKPANLFLAGAADGTLTVKLLDFGIAKVRADPLAHTADVTTTGAFLGSPLYMSPEQMQNSRDVDLRTDLWSLGCVLYAALAGRAPQQHLTTIGQLVIATCTAPVPALSSVAPWVPREVADAVHRALSIQPEARYPTAAAMLAALRDLVPPGSLTPEALADSDRARHERRSLPPPRGASPPSPIARSPRIVVASNSDVPIRADAATERADPPGAEDHPGWSLLDPDTLRSEPPGELPPARRPPSAPSIGGARCVRPRGARAP